MCIRDSKEIIHYFHVHYVDPRTGNPHPQTRIEAAMDTVKGVTIDPKRSAAEQAHEMLRKINDTGLALKRNEMEGTITVPQEHLGAATGIVKKWCTTRGGPPAHKREGDVTFYTFSVGVSPGDWDELMKELGKATHGNFTFDLPTPPAAKSRGGPPAAAAAADGGGKKGKKKG